MKSEEEDIYEEDIFIWGYGGRRRRLYRGNFFASQDADYLTKRELLQHCSKLREQKEAYERKHKTFWSEERKQSWLK